MQITVQVKLLPSKEQAEALRTTLETANAAASLAAAVAFEQKKLSRTKLHHEVYYYLRDNFSLSAQVAIRVIGKVVNSYKTGKKSQRSFKKHGAFPYDSRVLRWYTDRRLVSVWTVGLGRIIIPYAAGNRQLRFLQFQRGETDLVFRGGKWFLNTTCDVFEPDVYTPTDILGCDFGVANIVVTSDRQRFSGKLIEEKRKWYANRRKVLQSVGTKSAKRRLKKLSGKQKRFQRDVNHRIAKKLVLQAKRTKRAIALEDLQGLRERTRVFRGREHRASLGNWSFFQLRFFVEYKARGAGVPVILVDPAYTSQTCSECGHTARANRLSQDRFVCKKCGFAIHADLNAAYNIRDRAAEFIGLSSTNLWSQPSRVRDKFSALAGSR